jgi:hypothetical protein
VKRYAFKVSRVGKKPTYFETQAEAMIDLMFGQTCATLWVARAGTKTGGWTRQMTWQA